MRTSAVFCHQGLGDGVVSLLLSNNLTLNGFSVDTFHDTLIPLQHWFPHLPLLPHPSLHQLETLFQRYELFFVFHNDASPFVQKLIAEGKRRFPERIKVFYLYPSKNIIHEPYYQDTQINPMITVVENLHLFCERVMRLPKTSRSNGCIPPPDLTPRMYPQRVVFHPTGTRVSKNWPKERFITLAKRLKDLGYEVVWALMRQEYDEWPELANLGFPLLDGSLEHLARTLYESGYFIGNDSGPGHLASCLGVPTVTIARRKAYSKLWAPNFSHGIAVTPNRLIPNISGFRIRDRFWKRFISVNKVIRAFERLTTIPISTR